MRNPPFEWIEGEERKQLEQAMTNGWEGIHVFAFEAWGTIDEDTFLRYVRERYNPPGRIWAMKERDNDYGRELTGVALIDPSYPPMENRVLTGHPTSCLRFDFPESLLLTGDVE